MSIACWVLTWIALIYCYLLGEKVQRLERKVKELEDEK